MDIPCGKLNIKDSTAHGNLHTTSINVAPHIHVHRLSGLFEYLTALINYYFIVAHYCHLLWTSLQ